ncbi:protein STRICTOSIDINE SYNTHASE-LIKE 4-like [Primulina tabacum]|uniref:protein STRICTOSIDINE SYNTHASE-LIKE 4-like n=1 Tax=Primulina tabacum TaxID=48773 RepID=UPI003F59820B
MDSDQAIAPRNHWKTCSSFVIGCLVAVSLQVIFFSPISPEVLEFPPDSSVLLVQSNSKLQEVIKLGEGLLDKPEDVAIDEDGVLYTATRDGWIRRLHKNGTWENWWHVESEGLLGLTVTRAGDVIVCDAENGLLKVNEEGVKVLVSHFNDSKLRLVDDVIESSDGTLYFSDASTKFGLHDWHLDMLEAKPHGRLLKYDPASEETSIVLDKLAFANGVALSADQDFLVVCETLKFRCLKYWLKGDFKGETEIFIDNLPGTPDNINLAPDGSFWIALLQLVSPRLKFIHGSRVVKRVIASLQVSKWVFGLHKKATVVNVASNGKQIKRSFDDPTGKVMAFVTSVLEFEDHLYLGSLQTNFIGKLPLNSV